MKKAKLLIFDLDGTLIDSRKDIANAVNFSLQSLNLSTLQNEKIYRFIGDGSWRLIERALGEDNLDKLDNAVKLFRDYYGKHLLDYTTLYPSVENVLKYYRDKRKVVVTNKFESFSRCILNDLNVAQYFDIILGGDSVERCKPDPLPILKVMDELKVQPKETIMIGDGINDIIAARSAGVTSCAVGYGLEGKKLLLAQKPDFFIDSLEQIKEIIE